MVERVLEFSGIVSAAPVRLHGEVDLSVVIADAVDALKPDARDRGVTLTTRGEGLSPLVDGDAAALRSAILNIVGNAIKYSPPGGTVDIIVAARGDRVCLRVVDRGIGIDRDDLPHIFKPFYRGRRALDAQVRGTGVGLSVVGHVIDAHRGAMQVDSRPGQG